jgi:hypothetical protein
MSYTEFHKGKFKIVARGDEAIKKYIKDNNLEERIELDIDEKTGKIRNLEDKESFNDDKYDHEYHMIMYRRYLPNTYDRNPNAEHLLIKYINHEHHDLDDGDINIHNRVSKDEFEFAISFYNGGTYELEIYEDIINEFDLDEDYKKESEKINITPRESYMIERIEERVRNMVGPFYNMATVLKNLDDEAVMKWLINNNKETSDVMYKSIEYLIDMAKIIDEHLPKDFDINELLDKEKYQ